MKENNKLVLVSGGSGFIGKVVCKKLKLKGFRVFVLDSREFDLRKPLKKLPSDVSFVVHLAALTPRKGVSEDDFFVSNVRGTSHLVQALESDCPKLEKVVFVSSGSVYGSSENLRIEEELCKPDIVDHYAKSKLMSEQVCSNFCNRNEVSLVILRLFFVYGKDNNENRFLSKLVKTIKLGEPVCIDSYNRPRIQLINIDDVVNAIIKSIFVPDKFLVLNISGNQIISIRNLSLKIASSFNKEPKFILNVFPSKEFLGSNSKAKVYLDWEPKVSLTEGLNQLL